MGSKAKVSPTPSKILEHVRATDELLSRTAALKVVSSVVSNEKAAPSISQAELTVALAVNQAHVAEFIDAHVSTVLTSFAEFFCSLIGIAVLSNHRITRAAIFRTWPYVHGTFVDRPQRADIPAEKIWDGLCERLSTSFTILSAHANIREVAALEWDLMFGPLHPFYDGTGRTSRAFSLLVCLAGGLHPWQLDSRDEYLSNGRKGKKAFVEYLSERKPSLHFR